VIAAPTFNQIKAQVSAIAPHSHSSRVIGIHAKGRWTGNRQQKDGDQSYLIDQCDSPLALRIALQNGPKPTASQSAKASSKASSKEPIQVLITPLSESDLAEDILIRLTKQRLFAIDPWQIIKSLFRATNIDPRLIQHPWIPQALMDWMPANRYSPVMGGFLDAEVVWPLLLEHGLKLATDRPDLADILEWSTHPDHVALYRQSTEEFRLAACNWLIAQAGTATEAVLNCVAANSLPDALPLGLAAKVIFHPDAQNKLEKAIGKFEERFLSGQSPQLSTMQAWSIAASQALTALPANTQQALIQRSDAILAEVGAEDFAYLSTLSEQGFNQHLTELSKQLIVLLKKPNKAHLDKFTQTYQIVKSHQQTVQSPPSRRLERLDMALRLAQWLVAHKIAPAEKTKALEDAITYHTQEGSFLDWARLLLPMAEPHRELATAYSKLFETITTIRETQSQQFANLLKDWTAIGSTRKSVLPVEQILETVIAPLAETHPVLLIVLDGMSMSVAHEFLSDLTQKNWHLIVPENEDYHIQSGLAAIPSVTNVSRMSLLCGQLAQGESNKEVQGFTSHPDLIRHCKRNMPPLLFHKKGIQEIDTPTLSTELHSAIESDKNQVIGIVINAVDDLLAKGEQVDIAWTCDRIKVLQPILQAARTSKRLVIITSDHGHILHNNTQYQNSEGGERWRLDDGHPGDRELQISGERVLAQKDHSIIAPWTEQLRYCNSKKNGYHGGITPSEMLVPVAVLTTTATYPKSWKAADLNIPCWWKTSSAPEQVIVQTIQTAPEHADLGPIFSHIATLETTPQVTQISSWIKDLIQSPIYADQVKLMGNVHLPEEEVIQTLATLASKQGEISISSLQQVLNKPSSGLKVFLSSLQNVLNLEGYVVMAFDEATERITLNEPLLRQQFALNNRSNKT
jgi:hypothetical protein